VITFEPTVLLPHEEQLRSEVRAFVAEEFPFGRYLPALGINAVGSPEFSRLLGERGWLGMVIPKEYGGPGRTAVERFVVVEELLTAGAPISAHWVGDRQTAPGLLSYGTEEQRQRILPRIAAGRYFSAIGMSEPQAGSDLAAAAMKAVRTDGGWILSGKKVWTSGAHLAHQVVVLARTSPMDSAHRHTGFSQFIVPTDSPGLEISPIVLLTGEHHFNEIAFDEVFIDDTNLLGTEGDGWRQVTAELSFERSGPERILSTAPMITALVRVLAGQPDVDDHTAAAVGDLLAQLISLRQLSVSVARALADGRPQVNEAALVKDLGTRFEQESVQLAADLLSYVDTDAPGRAAVADLIDVAGLHAPMFTLRGGTNEVLRGMVAKGMGVR
jgi:acyl-CoA dehydrogenase